MNHPTEQPQSRSNESPTSSKQDDSGDSKRSLSSITRMRSVDLLLEAAVFAAHKHRDQRRKDAAASPYINHTLAVAHTLSHAGVDDVEALCAALLHDTIEDTQTTEAELREAFGERIASIVVEVTDDTALPKADRKRLQIEHAPTLTPQAKLVKLADKICNIRDVAHAPPSRWDLARRQEYFDWARAVVDGVRGTHPGLEALFDRIYRESRP